ncbi:MAG: hypothetical protein Q7T11_07255, partial [Deltaproteobacteria bacterium]|nr:hypothetical protein [Deltaproteobacteria bacterium]
KQTAAAVDRQPFGGVKLSGVGSKAGGRDYLSQFAKISRKNPVRLDAEANFELIGEKTAEKMFEGAIHQPQLLGESNRVDYHPRGTGLIVLDTFTDFSEAAGLLAAALFTGNNVRLLAAPNRKKEAEQLAKLWGRVRSDGFSFETVGMNAAEFEELFKVSSYPAYQWIAYHGQDITNPGSAYQKSVAKAVETPEGQRFVRSIIAPDDVYAEFASVFQGMTSPRTVTINTARHGLDARGSLTQAAPPALTMGTDSIREGAFDHLPHKEARARRTTAVGMKMFGFRGKGMRAQAGPRAAAHR